jgi:transforming growth factor-beta-induced protein
MLRLPTRRTLAGLLVAALVAAGCGDGDDDAASTDTTAAPAADDGADTEGDGDVLAVAAAEGDLGTYLEATEAAGIMDGLHGTGPFTVFIPTDDAFDAYLEDAGMTQAEVFGDAAMLRRLVEHHIVEMTEDADMVMAMDGQSFATAADTTLDVTVDGDTVMVGDATVERYDIQASNGVIHVIDTVLMPPAA